MGISKRMGDVLGQALEAKLLREVLEHEEKVNHLAIIMDGNRRFAWSKAIQTDIGHRLGDACRRGRRALRARERVARRGRAWLEAPLPM